MDTATDGRSRASFRGGGATHCKCTSLYMHALKQQRQDVMCPLFVATQEIYSQEWPPESWPPFALLLTHLLSKDQSMKTYWISWCIQSSSQAEAAASEVTDCCVSA